MIHIYVILGCLTLCLAIVVGILLFIYQPMARKQDITITTLARDVEDMGYKVVAIEKHLDKVSDMGIRDDIYVKLATLNNEVQRLKRIKENDNG